MQHLFSESKTLLPCVSWHLLGCYRLKAATPSPWGCPFGAVQLLPNTWCDGPFHPLPPAERFIKQECVGVKERRVLSMPLLKERRRQLLQQSFSHKISFIFLPWRKTHRSVPYLCSCLPQGRRNSWRNTLLPPVGDISPQLVAQVGDVTLPTATTTVAPWITVHYSNPCFCYGVESAWTPLL